MTKKEILKELDWWLKYYLEDRYIEETREDRAKMEWVVERNIDADTQKALAVVSVAYGLGLLNKKENDTIVKTIIFREVKADGKE